MNLCTSHVEPSTPTVLPTTRRDDDAERDGVGEAHAEPVGADDGDPGGEEGEHGHRDACRERPETVLEVLGQPGARDRRCGGSPAR